MTKVCKDTSLAPSFLRLCFALVLLASQALAEPEPSQAGRELFRLHCQSCHGVEGLGDGPLSKALTPVPRDLTQGPYKQGCGPGAIVKTLQRGVENSAMASYKGVLTEDEMWQLARYVRSLQKGFSQKR